MVQISGHINGLVGLFKIICKNIHTTLFCPLNLVDFRKFLKKHYIYTGNRLDFEKTYKINAKINCCKLIIYENLERNVKYRSKIWENDIKWLRHKTVDRVVRLLK